jgi:hypothetical protein
MSRNAFAQIERDTNADAAYRDHVRFERTLSLLSPPPPPPFVFPGPIQALCVMDDLAVLVDYDYEAADADYGHSETISLNSVVLDPDNDPDDIDLADYPLNKNLLPLLPAFTRRRIVEDIGTIHAQARKEYRDSRYGRNEP